jgi:hypothetical protein
MHSTNSAWTRLSEKEEKMAEETKSAPKVCAAGLDLGTMFLQSARDGADGVGVYNTVRDCFRDIDYDPDFEDALKSQKAHYVKADNRLFVLGDDAYMQAGMAEFGANLKPGQDVEILKRPMKDGILNPDAPKVSLTILRELMRSCLEGDIGPAREGEVLYFSVPANPVDSGIDNSFHSRMATKYLESIGFDARPLGEGLAVIFSENPKMHAPDGEIPFTGIGISMGAGQVNFCLSQRGVPLDEFSAARSGDWVDERAARMSGQPKTRVIRIKERDLDFNNIDEDNEVVLALECYYDELVRYVFEVFATRFKGSKGSIDHPIDIVLSGGTASPPGFDGRVKAILSKMDLPFEVKDVRLAKDMLRATALGCYIRAKQAAKKKGA